MTGKALFLVKRGGGRAPLSLSFVPILAAQVGDSYTFQVTGHGGTGPYTISLMTGSLPAGVSLNGSSGLVSGILTTAASYTMAFQITDALEHVANGALFTSVISSPVNAFLITGTPTIAGTVGTPITPFTMFASGQTGSVTWSFDPAYPVPTGLVIDASTGTVSGTSAANKDGTYRMRIRGVDSAAGVAYSALYTMAIQAAGATVFTQPLNPYSQKRLDGVADNGIASLHGQTFHERNSSNPDPNGTQRYVGDGALQKLDFPVRTGNSKNLTVRGGLVLGEISDSVDIFDWTAPQQKDGYENSAAMLMDGAASTSFHLYGLRVDHAWDGVQYFPKAGTPDGGPNETKGMCHHYIDGCWFSWGEDDTIEDDWLQSLTVTDTLIDRCYSGISWTAGDTVDSHELTDTATIDGLLMRLRPRINRGVDPVAPHYDYMAPFKSDTTGPSITISNSIIMIEGAIAIRKPYWVHGWQRMTNGVLTPGTNNQLLWRSDAAFPSTLIFGTGQSLPPGWTLVTGISACDAIWNPAREAWITAHPGVSKLGSDL